MTRASTDVLIDRIPVARNLATDAIWVIAFSLVTAICAQVSFHLPFSPVPITGQTFAVLLSGAVLGWRRAFLSQLTYLAEGAMGMPVFADGHTIPRRRTRNRIDINARWHGYAGWQGRRF